MRSDKGKARDPLCSVDCPTCGQTAGHSCKQMSKWTHGGLYKRATPHLARVQRYHQGVIALKAACANAFRVLTAPEDSPWKWPVSQANCVALLQQAMDQTGVDPSDNAQLEARPKAEPEPEPMKPEGLEDHAR